MEHHRPVGRDGGESSHPGSRLGAESSEGINQTEIRVVHFVFLASFPQPPALCAANHNARSLRPAQRLLQRQQRETPAEHTELL